MRILVLDHNVAFSDTLRVGLKAQGGHSVDAYTTAAEALAALERGESYALALVEHSVDGRAFLYRYKSIDPLLSVVILTALPNQETAVEFLRGGADALAIDYVQKPTPDLLRQLGDIINARFTRIVQGEWAVDRALRHVTYQGELLALRPIETEFFVYFMLHPYEPVTHKDLWLAARGETLDHAAAVAKVRAPLSRLRDKLEAVAGREVIQMQREVGFRFLPESVTQRVAGSSPPR